MVALYRCGRQAEALGDGLGEPADRRHALVEFDAARAAFESLGAELDLQRAARLLASA